MISLIALCGCGPDREAQTVFIDGRRLVTVGNYKSAENKLTQYIEQWPNGEHASRALFFLGKIELAEARYDRAAEYFNKCIHG